MNGNESIKVLHVFGFFDKGGAETMAMNLFLNIDRSKVEFDFVVHGDEVGAYEKQVSEMGAKIFRIPNYTGTNHFSYKRAWEKILEENSEYTIIHSHVRSTASIIFKIAHKYGLKTIAHSHNTSSGNGVSSVVKTIFQKGIRFHSDQFIACSKEAGEWLFGEKVCKQKNFNVLNNAIDAKSFAYNENIRKQKRKELGLEDQVVVGHVGRFHEQKNHLFLIDIFDRFHHEHPHSVLILVGEGDKTRKEKIKEKVRNLGIEDHVLFLGTRSDVKDLLQSFDVFLMPSLFEGLPVSLVETQAAGLPAVVSDTITKDIELTDLITYVDLQKSADDWAVTVWDVLQRSFRKITTQQIINGQYDIKSTSDWYQSFITELASKK